jgi:hypothetical protein
MASTMAKPTFTRTDGRPPKPGVIRFIDVPARCALALEGTDAPGSPAFQACIGALYTLAWSLKFQLKARGIGYKVPALEGFWSREGGQELPMSEPDPTAVWHWTLIIEVPPDVHDADLASAIEAGRAKHPEVPLDRVELRTIDEGRCVEALHVGPYATEPDTLVRMEAEVEAAGLRVRPSHHEIYLSDPGRTAPEKLKTLLRQQVE